MRRAVMVLGIVVGGYGAWLLLSRSDSGQLLNVAQWLVAGVVLHDFVLAPLALALVLGAARAVPRPARGPAVAGFVVLGTVTVMAFPVLGGFGAGNNPSLNDRNYLAGWLVLAALTVVCVLVATYVVRSRHGSASGRSSGGASPRGR